MKYRFHFFDLQLPKYLLLILKSSRSFVLLLSILFTSSSVFQWRHKKGNLFSEYINLNFRLYLGYFCIRVWLYPINYCPILWSPVPWNIKCNVPNINSEQFIPEFNVYLVRQMWKTFLLNASLVKAILILFPLYKNYILLKEFWSRDIFLHWSYNMTFKQNTSTFLLLWKSSLSNTNLHSHTWELRKILKFTQTEEEYFINQRSWYEKLD